MKNGKLLNNRFEAAERVCRVSEILAVKYIDGKKSAANRDLTANRKASLARGLERLDLRAEAFEPKVLAKLAQHCESVCRPRPRCQQCPLVSFCSTGGKRVRQHNAPIVIDLFGGSGGMGFGFRNAGYRIGLAVEIDRNAAQTYRINNPGTVVLEEDVTRLSSRDILKIVGSRPAVICAGPPCQSYSIAGVRKSRDPRHHLFRHVLAIARELKPDVVLIENVPGVGMTMGSRNYLRIIESELGQSFTPEVYLLRAVEYGVPQVRRRYFFIGRRRRMKRIGKPRATHKEKGASGPLPVAPTVAEVLRELPRRSHGCAKDWTRLQSGCIVWNVGTMLHSKRVIRKIKKIRGGEGPISYRRVSKTYANTIIAGHRALPVHPTCHRTMNVREAAAIQGFPSDYVFMGSRANQPLQVANAVPPPLAEAIARHLKRRVRKHG